MWYRSRNRLAPLEGLWRPLLKSAVPSDPVAKAHGLLLMFQSIIPAIPSPLCSVISNWTAIEHWYSRFDREHEFSTSLLLELERGQIEVRRQQYEDSLLTQINEPKHGSAPFWFFLNSTAGLNQRRMEATNRLLRIVPHSGLALSGSSKLRLPAVIIRLKCERSSRNGSPIWIAPSSST